MFCGIRLNVQHLLTIWHYNFASIDHHLLVHNWYHGMKQKISYDTFLCQISSDCWYCSFLAARYLILNNCIKDRMS